MKDDQLVTLSQEGNQEAFAALYEKYFDAIYRFFYWQTNRNQEIAEDLTQDTFLDVAKSIKNFNNQGSFKNWLYTIAKSKLSKWIKSKYDLPKEPLFDNFEYPENSIDPDHQKKATTKVERLLDKLNEKERKVVILRYLKNYSVKEVAKELNISMSNVKVITHRAITKMKCIEL